MVGLISFCYLKEWGKKEKKKKTPKQAEQGCEAQWLWREATAVVFMVNQVCLFLCRICLLLLLGHM